LILYNDLLNLNVGVLALVILLNSIVLLLGLNILIRLSLIA